MENLEENTLEEISATKTEELTETLPNYDIADLTFQLEFKTLDENESKEIKKKLINYVEKNAMLPYYKFLCETFGWMEDQAIIENMEKQNKEELEKLDAKILDAEQNFGVFEVREALSEKAHFYCKVGEKELTLKTLEETFEKTVGSGTRLDTILMIIRIGFFYSDLNLIKYNINRAKDELEKGGDWERRNKLKVYEALLYIMCRKFKEAALLLLSCISTFTAFELMSFESFIFYVIILSMFTLDRSTLKTKVVNSPEVLQILAEDENLKIFLNSFFECRYLLFNEQFVKIAERIKLNRYMTTHYSYLIQNIRLKAYSQFLEPYKSVTIENMANAFGVSSLYIENEIALFISTKKLNWKIDRVNKIINSNDFDARNKFYQEILNKGDVLLNRIQRLSRIIDV